MLNNWNNSISKYKPELYTANWLIIDTNIDFHK